LTKFAFSSFLTTFIGYLTYGLTSFLGYSFFDGFSTAGISLLSLIIGAIKNLLAYFFVFFIYGNSTLLFTSSIDSYSGKIAMIFNSLTFSF